MNRVLTRDALVKLAREWQESAVFLTACRLDVFSYLKDYMSSKELAESLGIKERYIERLLNTLVILGLVEKAGGKYKNTSVSDIYLDKNSDSYLLGLKHSAHMLYYWSFLYDVIKIGKPAKNFSYVKPVENWTEDFISAMEQYATERAPELVKMLDLSGAGRMLDLGGGSGANAVEIAKNYPEIEVVIFDLPGVIPMAKKFISQKGNFNNICFMEGDYLADNIGKDYGAILLSQIIHAHGKEDVIRVLSKCRKALKRGGRIYIHDFLIDEDRTSPPSSVFFSLNMLVHTEEGDTYTLREVKEFLDMSGFTFLDHKRTTKGSDVVIAKS